MKYKGKTRKKGIEACGGKKNKRKRKGKREKEW